MKFYMKSTPILNILNLLFRSSSLVNFGYLRKFVVNEVTKVTKLFLSYNFVSCNMSSTKISFGNLRALVLKV